MTVRLGAATPAPCWATPTALRRALLNLVENAVKYTPAGGKVELSPEPGDGGPRWSRWRTPASASSPADAERIFEPFVRLDAARSRETGGAGLGLAIARSIVVAHGGTLSVESRPGPAAASRSAFRWPPPDPGSHPPLIGFSSAIARVRMGGHRCQPPSRSHMSSSGSIT